MNVIILDNYKGIRKLNADDSYPIALESVYDGQRILDWHIRNINRKKVEYVYVGGYHIEKIINNYSDFTFYYDKNKETSLKIIYDILNLQKGDCVIIPSNILYKTNYLDCVLKDTQAINLGICEECIDERFSDIKILFQGKEFYYNGIIKLNNNKKNLILENMRILIEKKKNATFLQWIKCVVHESYNLLNFFDSENLKDLINFKHKIGLSKFILGTKAQTLETLKNLVKNSTMLEQVYFTVKEWNYNKEYIYFKIKQKYTNNNIVIRSSSLSEDCFNESNAGKFQSYLNVNTNDKEKVIKLIDNVIKSYGNEDLNNQVLVQQYISDSIMSGVLFTRNLEDSAPYYLINYDDESGLTDTVTSGKVKNIKSKYILKNNTKVKGEIFQRIINSAKEIENLISYDALDMEFIVARDNIYIVQVRPIASYDENKMILTDDDVFKEVESLKKYVSNIFEKKSYIAGKTTMLGNMPDWNPAELIGSIPRPLSLSIYQKLITNGIWAIAREQLGYKSLGYEPLVVSLSGKPYVDVRKSLNSFIPKDLNEELSEKIINYQINKLKEHPYLHDKLEFKIAQTILDFNFKQYKEELVNHSFKEDEVLEFEEALKKLTNNIFDNMDVTLKEQRDKIKLLTQKRESIEKSDNINMDEIPNVINILINDCILYGILPFSILARYAFISMSYLKSLKEKSIISEYEYDRILLSIPTVASEFMKDSKLLNLNKISKSEFLSKYGHLRPNTYDINSLNYKEGYNVYFDNNINTRGNIESEHESSWIDDIFGEKGGVIDEELNRNSIKCDYLKLKSFIKQSIAGRESSKFEFSKNINLILELIIKLGERYNLTRDDMSYISIDKISSISKESPSYSFEKELKRECEYRKKKYTLTHAIKLPSLIVDSTYIDEFSIIESSPNYITNKMITCEIIEMDITNNLLKNIDNKIVMVENADPGYDWIFSHKIKGLITKYGGAASHMSIRCAEFGIPAAIGAGEIIYNKIKNANLIELNCESKQIRVIK